MCHSWRKQFASQSTPHAFKSRNPIALAVKLADLEDNMDVRRLPTVTEKDAARLAKYAAARKMLMNV